jgi:protein tyrosine phosphatase (PTP) superfamily phosphohydrolase (DUF442 family)
MAASDKVTRQSNEKSRVVKLRYIAVLSAVAIVGLTAAYLVQTGGQENSTARTRAEFVGASKWAERLKLPGVTNLHKVSENLYRGAQPTAEGMQQLEKLGIKTVVSLRSFHSDRGEMEGTALAYEHIFMKTWHPEDEEVVRFLRIVTDPNRTPVFVHCQRGADRTGTMCAIYRIAVQGWSKPEAIEEMTKGGFGFYEGRQNLIDYIQKLDVEGIKSRAKLN